MELAVRGGEQAWRLQPQALLLHLGFVQGNALCVCCAGAHTIALHIQYICVRSYSICKVVRMGWNRVQQTVWVKHQEQGMNVLGPESCSILKQVSSSHKQADLTQ